MFRYQRARSQWSQDGFTLVEVTIIMLVLVILSMIMLPQLGNFNRLARKVYATEDVAALCATLKKVLDEVGAPVNPAPNVTVGNWNLDCPNEPTSFKVTPDIVTTAPALATSFGCDRFQNHLQVNDPGIGSAFDPGDLPIHRYKNQSGITGVGAFLGWRGPYLNQINTDPWGTRYMSNPFGLHSDSNGNTFSTPVVCISFGPNTVAETSINMEHPRLQRRRRRHRRGAQRHGAVLAGRGC